MATPNPREVLELANEIVRIEDQLASLRAKWDSMFSTDVVDRKPTGRPVREDSVAAQVLATINADAAIAWDAESLSDRLSVARDTVGSALYNLFVAKKIARVGRGKYGAANPYADQIDLQLEKERNAA